MKKYAVLKFLRVYGKSLPLNKKFNFTGFCKDVKSLIDDDYDYLLMKNKHTNILKNQKELLKRKIKLDLKSIESIKNEFFEKKRNNLLKKQKLMLSAYNNKMMLDMMFNDKRYIKYITEKNIENLKTRDNNSKCSEIIDESINNDTIENKKTRNIFSSLNTFETIDELGSQKSISINKKNKMNKTFSKIKPNILESLFNQRNDFFTTALPINQLKLTQTIRNSLFNIHHKNNRNKYDINNSSKFPNLLHNYINSNSKDSINLFNKTGSKKNSELKKSNNNYNKKLRNQIILTDIHLKKKTNEKNNDSDIISTELNVFSRKNNAISPKYKTIRLIKSNILKDENPIKITYKKKINF